MANDDNDRPGSGPSQAGRGNPVIIDLEDTSRQDDQPTSDDGDPDDRGVIEPDIAEPDADTLIFSEPASANESADEGTAGVTSADEPSDEVGLPPESAFEAAPVEIEGAAFGGPESLGAVGREPLDHASAGRAAASGVAAAGVQPRRRAAPFGALLAAAILGGFIMALGLVALDRAGLHPFTIAAPADVFDAEPEIATLRSRVDVLDETVAAEPPASVDLAPLDRRIADLETAVAASRETASRPAPAAASGGPEATADGAKIQALEARFAAMETRATALPSADPALTGRLDELSRDIETLKANVAANEALSETVAGLTTRLDAEAARLSAVEARPVVDLAGIETAVTALQGGAADLSARLDRAPAEDRVAALETAAAAAARQAALSAALGPAVAANTLGAAVEAGAPFAAELSAMRGLGVDEASLAPLVPHAARGLPTIPALRASFDEAIATVDLTTPVPAGAGPLDRLLGSARSLVEVRPADPGAGSDPGSIVARIRAALDGGDVAKALTEREALPDHVKAATANWAEIATARRDADVLVLKLRSDALAKLGADGDAASDMPADPAPAVAPDPAPAPAPSTAPTPATAG